MGFVERPKRRFRIAKRDPREMEPPRVASRLEGKVKNRGIKPKRKKKSAKR